MVWSLYKRDNNSEGIFDFSGEKLEPLVFSNGKSQEDIVNEIQKEINNGHKVIFVKGVCGSGKSAIALNLAKNYKKSSIVVPIKSLQEQYEQDYTKSKFILKDDKQPLKISIIKGRANFSCPFGGDRANDPENPCTIEIREKNIDQLLKYIDQNPNVNKEDFSTVSDIRRTNIAAACPYWSPLLPEDAKPKGLDDIKKIKFSTVSGKDFALFQRKPGCKYYEQYSNYADADVLIFNSAKYLIEVDMGRKPKTEIDIIDECDEFLDNFSNEKKINLQRLFNALSSLMPEDKEKRNIVKELIQETNNFLFKSNINVDCEKVKKTEFSTFLQKILDNPNLAEDEELNYYNNVVEIMRSFEKVLEDTYLSAETITPKKENNSLFSQRFQKTQEDNVILTLVSINLAEKMHELTEQGNILVLMSGTLHSEEVLKDIFGLKDFKIIEAETKNPGEIKLYRTGVEKVCSYANFKNQTVTRERYLKMLDCCLANTEGQTLIHVNSFSDLPSEIEKNQYQIHNIMTQEELKDSQRNANNSISEFTSKQKKHLFTTKCSRGIDFAGETCRNVILTKYPFPNIQGLFWKILRKEQPENFREFYTDKARRELIQKVSRGVRFKEDWVNLLSPDSRVLNPKNFD